jgi:manganese oxidase
MSEIFNLSQIAISSVVVMVVLARSSRRAWRLGLLVTVVGAWFALSGASMLALSRAVAQSAEPPRATSPGNPCPGSATPDRVFNVSLINIPLFLNRFGDVVPDGRMYILNENITEARQTFQDAADPFKGNQRDIIEPLSLRVNKGDCVEVNFTNRLDEPAPNYNRNDSIFTLPGETLRAPGTITHAPGEFAPSEVQPNSEFNPAAAPAASMHFDGLSYDVKGSDGTAVGKNPNSTVPAGLSTTYRLYAGHEGEYQFKDGADLSSVGTHAGNHIGSGSFGAFGAITVEPPGATWVDAHTGAPIKSGTRAIIRDPNGPDFREHVVFMHDEVEANPGIITPFCVPPLPNPHGCKNPTPTENQKLKAGTIPAFGGGDADALINGETPAALEFFAFNYRSEPGINREEVGCRAKSASASDPMGAPACVGEETSLSSWPYGDPGGGDLVFHSYRGEPTQIRLFHTAEAETHTFHWHVNRWPFDVEDEGGLGQVSKASEHTNITNPLDVQAVSPGAHYSLAAQGGAGSAHDDKPATFGDVIFHCHLYPHFASGMWALNRTHDVLEDGTRKNPDGTSIPALEPVNGFAPPAPTASHPGFPFFVPGEFGHKPPKAPLSVPERRPGGVFEPTAMEKEAADGGAQKPGAFFQDPCPATHSDGSPTPLKVFDVAAIQLKVQYNNDLKWNDPQHRIYVLQKDKDAVLSGTKKPEPFSPLLNVGDCVEYRLTNELPEQFGGTVFDRAQITNEVGIHQHLVQFDVLSSDGTANGWNYDQGADAGQTITYRDYVSEDIKTNSFHDHFYPVVHQDNGLYGGATVHPAGCDFFNPVTGNAVTVGTVVDVRCGAGRDDHGHSSDGRDYRNISLFIEDHVPMFKPENPNDPSDDKFATSKGVPIFPAHFPSSPDDYGTMGLNYRLEPFEARRGDPASLFSSATHGDPYTPVPQAYAGDRVKFRLFQLSSEESHGFNMHRFRWKDEPNDPDSNVLHAKHIGMLEAFDLTIPEEDLGANRKGLEMEDYLYYFGGSEDWFLGAWGIFRLEECNPTSTQESSLGMPALQPLPDNPTPNCPSPSTGATRTVGNPCPTNSGGDITAPVKKFDVAAINRKIVYNSDGVHDPDGLMYVLEEDRAAVESGAKEPEPLVIRANVGDCIEVTLNNRLDPTKMKPHCFEAREAGQLSFKEGILSYPECLNSTPQSENELPGFKPFPVSSRVSINPKLVDYDIGSDGANVGYNFDSTVGPGGTITYRWFAPKDFGMANFGDRGDVQNHLHHGLYGALNIEPKGSEYLDPKDGSPLKSGAQAVIKNPNGPDFRENTVFMNNDLALFRAGGFPVEDNLDLRIEPSHIEDDPEDQGEFGIGYRNEPFVHRYLDNKDMSLIFSSHVHGDPDTPLFEAYSGDPVRFRVSQPQGDPRSTGFALHGHLWRRAPEDPQSQLAAFQGQFNPAVAYNIHLEPGVAGGAGGPKGFPGDYLYRSGTLFRHLVGGQWGIFRVFDDVVQGLIELPDRSTDTTAPVVTIDSKPTDPTSDNSPSFSFSVDDQSATVECSLSSGADNYQPCSSPKSYTSLADGTYTFKVRATDAAGNAGSASYSFMIATGPTDTTAPVVQPPAHDLVANTQLGTTNVPVRISWSGSDGGSGVKSYELQQSVDGAAFTNVALPSATATTITPLLAPGSTYRYQVRATDNAGNVSTYAAGQSFTVNVAQETSRAIVDTGTWTTATLTGAYGGSVQHASAAGRKATFTFSGSHVAWVAHKAAARGIAEVWVDGVKAATVDLYSATMQPRRVVFSKGGLSAAGSHALEVRVLGTKNASATATRVDVDAFVVLQ